jgi:hypothetical protein
MIRCDQIRPTLLECRKLDELEPKTREHIYSCEICKIFFDQLISIDQKVLAGLRKNTGSIPKNFFERLKRTPQEIILPNFPFCDSPTNADFRWRWITLSTILALLVGIGIGWTAKPRLKSPEPVILPEPITPFLISVARYVTAVSQGDTWERHRAYAALNRELQLESARSIYLGAFDQSLILGYWYMRVWREGSLPLLQKLPLHQQEQAKKMLRQEWQQGRVELLNIRKQSPQQQEAIATILNILAEAEKSLDGSNQFRKYPELEATTPTEQLIKSSLALSQTDDPLNQAVASKELAKVMAQIIVLMSDFEQHQQAAELGEYFNQVLTNGVASNLEKADKQSPNRKELNEVREESLRTVQLLESNLGKGNGTLQKGLQRAIEVSQQGRGRLMGKGPTWKNGDDWPSKGPKIPPGWEKKGK